MVKNPLASFRVRRTAPPEDLGFRPGGHLGAPVVPYFPRCRRNCCSASIGARRELIAPEVGECLPEDLAAAKAPAGPEMAGTQADDRSEQGKDEQQCRAGIRGKCKRSNMRKIGCSSSRGNGEHEWQHDLGCHIGYGQQRESERASAEESRTFGSEGSGISPALAPVRLDRSPDPCGSFSALIDASGVV